MRRRSSGARARALATETSLCSIWMIDAGPPRRLSVGILLAQIGFLELHHRLCILELRLRKGRILACIFGGDWTAVRGDDQCGRQNEYGGHDEFHGSVSGEQL